MMHVHLDGHFNNYTWSNWDLPSNFNKKKINPFHFQLTSPFKKLYNNCKQPSTTVSHR